MKSTGEVLCIGKTFKELFMKAKDLQMRKYLQSDLDKTALFNHFLNL